MLEFNVGDKVIVEVALKDRECEIVKIHPFDVYEVKFTDGAKRGIRQPEQNIRVGEEDMTLIEEK